MTSWKTARGLTLLEQLIACSLVALMLSLAVPSFGQMSAALQMRRAASELKGFMDQSRTEAVVRNQDLWAHISDTSNSASEGYWKLTLTNSEQVGEGEAILVIDSRSFQSIAINWNYSVDQIKFDAQRGRVKNGTLNLYLVDDEQQMLRLKSSFSNNRVMICGVGETRFGYSGC